MHILERSDRAELEWTALKFIAAGKIRGYLPAIGCAPVLALDAGNRDLTVFRVAVEAVYEHRVAVPALIDIARVHSGRIAIDRRLAAIAIEVRASMGIIE